MRVRKHFHEANNVVAPGKRALRRSQNNRNVGTCCAKRLTGLKLYVTSGGSMQTDATSWAKQCCALLANSVASVCMGLSWRSATIAGLATCIF